MISRLFIVLSLVLSASFVCAQDSKSQTNEEAYKEYNKQKRKPEKNRKNSIEDQFPKILSECFSGGKLEGLKYWIRMEVRAKDMSFIQNKGYSYEVVLISRARIGGELGEEKITRGRIVYQTEQIVHKDFKGSSIRYEPHFDLQIEYGSDMAMVDSFQEGHHTISYPGIRGVVSDLEFACTTRPLR